jgi:hypothetical protein
MNIPKLDEFVEKNKGLFSMSSDEMKISKHPPNYKNIQIWLKKHENTPEQSLSVILANNILNVSYDTMVKVFNNIVNELFVLQESSKKRLYIYVPNVVEKSNFFFTVFFYWLCKLKNIEFIGVVEKYTDYADNIIVIVDDASYSGIQLSTHIEDLGSNDADLFIAVPYISDNAKKLMIKTNNRVIIPSSTTTFYSIRELIQQGVDKYIPTKGIGRDHLLYFDFKLPDYVSIPQTIFAYGYNIAEHFTFQYEDSKDVLPLISGCDEAYRKHICHKGVMDINDVVKPQCPNPFYKKIVWKK